MFLLPPELYTVAEIATFSKLTLRANEHEFVDYLDTGNLTEGLIQSLEHYSDLSKLPSRAKKIVIEGDILFSTVRPNNRHYGIIHGNSKNLVVSTGFSVIRANRNIVLPEYLYYHLTSNSTVELLQSIAEQSVSAYPSINDSDIGKLEFKIPDTQIQKAVIKIIESINQKLSINREINANLIERINTMFNNWMYAHSSISKDSSDSNSWHIGSIYEFLKITYGAPFSSNLFNSESRGCPLIRIRDLKTNLPQIYTDENHPKQTVVSPGDILVGMDAEFKPYVWLGKTGVLNQRVAKIDSILDGVCDYLIMLLIRPELEFIESYKTGTTVSHIGKEDFDQMKVVVPSCEDMISFSSTIKPMYDLIVELGEEKMILEELRDTLLPRLISGEIDVSNLPLPN